MNWWWRIAIASIFAIPSGGAGYFAGKIFDTTSAIIGGILLSALVFLVIYTDLGNDEVEER